MNSFSSFSGFNLHHTDDIQNGLYYDCLYYYVPKQGLAYQRIEYCIRSELEQDIFHGTGEHQIFDFKDLRQENITSQQLYEWLAPINLIENYQSYLENHSLSSTFIFHNCTFPWFGSRCEYSFDKPEISFSKQVQKHFSKKTYGPPAPNMFPCYRHLACNRTGGHGQAHDACLDWREVCDGKVDCLNGEQDEEQCWQLEINECDRETEFRCQNGQCIPVEFLLDDKNNADCLDRSDEEGGTESTATLFLSYMTRCYEEPSFRCEEYACRQRNYNKPVIECGDGSCADLFSVSCKNGRNKALINGFLTGLNVSEECRNALGCLTGISKYSSQLDKLCKIHLISTYVNLTKEHCPPLIVFPPIFFGHVYFVYNNDQSRKKLNFSNLVNWIVPPDYICYNEELCGYNLTGNANYRSNYTFNYNSVCRLFEGFNIPRDETTNWPIVTGILYRVFHTCSSYHQPISKSIHFNLYQCANSSKIITKHRLVDKVPDCLYEDDESFTESCSLNMSNHRLKCVMVDRTICFPHVRIGDTFIDCINKPVVNIRNKIDPSNIISFQTICDGYTELSFMMIDGRNETDETECNYFPCNNTYTRCDGYWNCPDGADEVNCEWPPICPSLHHLCLSSVTWNVTCLHISRINDGISDCLGGTDERKYCRQFCNGIDHCPSYRCWNSSRCIPTLLACSEPLECPVANEISTNFCQQVSSNFAISCLLKKTYNYVEQMLCNLDGYLKTNRKYLKLSASKSLYPLLAANTNETQQVSPSKSVLIMSNQLNIRQSIKNDAIAGYCSRGIAIHRLSKYVNKSELVCLCPPAYHGRRCENQTQRVSLTVQLQVLSDWRNIFGIVVTLLDDQQGLIESYDQFDYLPIVDCNAKYNIYLLYTTRPKNISMSYTVRIDMYDKALLEYRASWSFPIRFSFLPVYRMAVKLVIPPTKTILNSHKEEKYGIHGLHVPYVNSNTSFCQCDKGWLGIRCNIQYSCNCSSDSLCLGPNICLCSSKKFGPRCYLQLSSCPCKNGGFCIWNDQSNNRYNNFLCGCVDGFSGRLCEIRDTEILISFASDMKIPPSMLLHFINVNSWLTEHIYTTVFKKLALDQDIIKIYTSYQFHLLFVEIEPKSYYLSVLQETYQPSANITSELTQSKRCLSIVEIFNASITKMHLLRRIKLYHIPCKQRTKLACFYDEIHMCICDHDIQQANCFEFNHSMVYNCKGRSLCENGGRCFYDKSICPTLSMCVCDECSYGSLCQFSTKGFSVSLDILLGYQIRPDMSFGQQRLSIKIITVIVTIMLVCGLISSILSIMTFQTKNTREVGCGYYLLISSYASCIIFIVFALKSYILIMSQMNLITNHIYLSFNCILTEYLIKILMNISDWLNACVGVERAIAATQENHFNKRKQKKLAKWIIFAIFILTVTSNLQDPMFRRLIYDKEEHRRWCMVKYSSSVHTFNSIVLLFHFLCPFILNIVSALIIIFKVARRRFTTQKKLSYRKHLKKQLYKFKYLLISPSIMIILGVPRLIISFISRCMKSPRNPWLFLFGYFISFAPPMLIFFVFVLPSKKYLKEFQNSIRQITRILRQQ